MSYSNPIMKKIVGLKDLQEMISAERKAGKKLALANGTFDFLHVGHTRYLVDAAEVADILVVAVNADSSVRSLKGPGRPIMPEQERAELVASIQGVDWVTIFAEKTVAEVIRSLKPDFQVKGTDYTADTVPEADIVRSLGGQVVIVGDPKDHASSHFLKRLQF